MWLIGHKGTELLKDQYRIVFADAVAALMLFAVWLPLALISSAWMRLGLQDPAIDVAAILLLFVLLPIAFVGYLYLAASWSAQALWVVGSFFVEAGVFKFVGGRMNELQRSLESDPLICFGLLVVALVFSGLPVWMVHRTITKSGFSVGKDPS